MASKGRRDVELVIRAKNEASKAIDAISSAFDTLTGKQKKASDGAATTASTLDKLGTELGKLLKAASGVPVLDRMAASLGKAQDAADRLQKSVASTAEQQAALNIEIQQGEAALAGLTAAQAKAQAGYDKQKAKVDAAKQAQVEYRDTLREATKDQKTAAAAHDRLGAAFQKEQQKLEVVAAAQNQAADAVNKASEPTRKQIADYERLSAAYDKQKAKTDAAAQAWIDAAGASDKADAALEKAQARAATLAENLDKAKAAETEAANALKLLRDQAASASGNLGKLRSDQEALTAVLAQQNTQLEKTQVGMAELDEASRQAQASLSKVADVTRSKLLRVLFDGQKQLTDFKASWEAATAGIAASAAGGATPTASPVMAAQIEQAQAAKTAYLTLRDALQQMRQAVRDAGDDIGKLSEAQQTFVAAIDRVTGAERAVVDATKKVAAASKEAADAENKEAAAKAKNAAASDEAAKKNRLFAETLAAIGVNSRKSMSWLQRVRSEVVALTTSYVGLFAAIQQAGDVIDAVRTMQGAEQKLGVAFNGDMAKAGQELEWLHDLSVSVGADFKGLTKEYSDFAVAVNQSPKLAGQARALFKPFADAGTVLHLTADQMNLVVLALSQMVNKGTVSMEELRRQLGEQIPGAFELAAKAMGLTGQELNKLVSTGQLATEDFLPKFAAQIEKTFGPQLPDAVKSLNSEINRFKTHLFDLQLTVANGGFLGGLQDALKSLNTYFESPAGEKFFANLGAAAGGVLKLLATMVEHLGAITTIFELWLARKFTSIFVSFASDLGKALAAAKAMPAVMAASAAATEENATATKVAGAAWTTLRARVVAAGVSITATTAEMSAARLVSAALTGAMGLLRGALAALGGIPGLVITGLTFLLTAWLTKTDDLADANDHLVSVIGKVQRAYEDADKSASGFLDTIKKATAGDLVRAQQKAADALADLRRGTPAIPGGSSGTFAPTAAAYGALEAVNGRQLAAPNAALNQIAQAFRKGALSAEQYKDELSDLLVKFPNMDSGLKKQWDAMNDAADKAVELSKNTKVAAAELAFLNGTATDAQKALLPWAKGQSSVNDALDKGGDALAKVTTAVNKLNPLIKDETTRDKALASLDQQVKLFEKLHPEIDKTTQAYKDYQAAVAAARAGINEKYDQQAISSTAKRIIGVESGGDANAKNPNSTATGLGQFIESTWLRLFRQYFPEQAQNMGRDAILDLRRDQSVATALVEKYAEENAKVLQQAGQSVNQASIYLAHFLGPQGALKVLQAAPGTPVSSLLSQKAIAANPSVLGGGKTAGDVVKWAQRRVGLSDQEAAIEGKINEIEASRAQKAKAFHDQLAQNLEIQSSQNAVAKKRTLQEEINVALLKAQNDAKKAGTTLSDDEVKRVTEVTTQLYNQKHAQDAINEAKKTERDLEKKDRDLTSLRSGLTQQAQLAQQSGDLAGYQQIQNQIKAVDTALAGAIQNEIAFWNTAAGQNLAGSPDAAAAKIAELELRLKGVQDAAARAKIAILGLTVGDIANALRSSVISGVDSLIDKIGEAGLSFKTLGDAFRAFAADFLKQIAKMILQQAIFNALQMAGKATGGWFGAILTAAGSAATHHTGGVAGSSAARRRSVASGWFQNAVRYHSGGIAGLAPNEVPAVLQKGEEVLTKDDPRHIANGGAVGGNVDLKVVNTIDAGSFVSEGLNSPVGGKAFFNFIRANQTSFRRAAGIA